MNVTIRLKNELAGAPKACAGVLEQFVSALPSSRQARRNEKLCSTCPALELCTRYTESLERWQLQGTMAGTTYRKVKSPEFCGACSAAFFPSRPGRQYCSLDCVAEGKRLRGEL